MTTRERYQIVVASGLSLPTVTKWDKGKPVHHLSELKIREVAKRLGLFEKREAKP
jgi:hypothetical protein